MGTHTAKPEHQVAYQDLAALLSKNANDVSAPEMLAIAANLVGKLIAMQDQRTMTKERAMKIVSANIEMGNAHVIEELSNKTDGNA